MTEILKLAELAQYNRPPQCDRRCRRVQAELHAQGLAFFDARRQLLGREKRIDPAKEVLSLR